MNSALLFALGCAVLAIVYGFFSIGWILRQPEGNERMARRKATGKDW